MKKKFRSFIFDLVIFYQKLKYVIGKIVAFLKYSQKLYVKTEDLPTVTIIASVFDADEYIDGYLADITQQSIFIKKCQLILVNANSPGNEDEIIFSYLRKYPNNIIYKKLNMDPGIYAVWNIAIQMSSGEFITNANLDDRKAPYSIEKHAKALHVNSRVDLVYSDSYILREPNVSWGMVPWDSLRYCFPFFSPKAMLKYNLPHNNPMWRRSLHERFGYFNENYRSAADWDFWLTCVSQGVSFEKIPAVLGIYYLNPKGMSTNIDNLSWRQKEELEIYQKFSKLI